MKTLSKSKMWVLPVLWCMCYTAWAVPLQDNINGIWQDSYDDSVAVVSGSNVVVSNGVVSLSACDGTVSSGEYITTIIAPSGLSAWGELAIDGIVSASTVTVEVYADDGAVGVTGPSLGSGTAFPLDLSGIDADVNPALEVRVLLTYDAAAPCPAISELSVTWKPEATLLTAKRAPATVAAGDNFTYTLRLSVSNTDADSVVLYDTVPALADGMVIQPEDYGQNDSPVFVSAQQGGEYTTVAILIDTDGDAVDDFPIPANSVYWNLGTLAAGDTQMYQYSVRAPNGALDGTDYLNTATAESANATTVVTNQVTTTVINSVVMLTEKQCTGPVFYTDIPDLCRITPDATVTFQVSVKNRIDPTSLPYIFDSRHEPLLDFRLYDDVSEVCAALAGATPSVVDCSTAISAISGGGAFDPAYDHDSDAGTAPIQAIVWPTDSGPLDNANESYAVDFTGVAGGTTFTNTVCGDSLRGPLECDSQDSRILTQTPGGIGGKGATDIAVWEQSQNITYSLAYRNAGLVELNDIILFDRMPDEVAFLSATTPAAANATIFYSTESGFTDPGTPPDYDLGDVLDTVAPADIDVGANTFWDTAVPADPSTVTWVAIFIPALSSPLDAAPSAPTSVTAGIQARVRDGDVCSPLNIVNQALKQVNASTNLSSARTATGFALSTLGIDDTDVVAYLPELVLSKNSSVNPDPLVTPGTQTFTLEIDNLGDTAQTVDATISWPQIAVNGVASYPGLVSASGGALDLTNIAIGQLGISGIGPISAGSSITLTVTLRIPNGVVDGTSYALSYTLTPVDDQCSVASVSDSIATSLLSTSNLEVIKTVSPSLLSPGAEFSYELTYSNLGPGVTTGTYVVDALPENTVFLSAEFTNGEQLFCSGPPLDATLPSGLSPATPIDSAVIASSFTLGTDTGSGVWTCPFGEQTTWIAALVDDTSLSPNQLGVLGARSFTLTMRNDEDTGVGQVNSPNGTVWLNAPAIFSNELLQAIGNSVLSVVTDQAALKIDKTGPGVVGSNSEFIWEIGFENDSTAPLTTAAITDALPSGTTFVSATLSWNDEAVANGQPSTPQAIVPSGNNFLIAPAARGGDLLGREGGTLAITVLTDASSVTGTLILNTACGNGTDGVGVGVPEVCDSDVIEVQNPELELNKLASPPDPRSGDTITYTLLFGNRNQVPAPDIVISDTLPADVTYIPGSVQIVSPLFYSIGEPAISGQNLSWSVADGNALTNIDIGLDTIEGTASYAGDIVIQYEVTVNTGVADGVDLVNRAAIATSAVEDAVFDSDDCGGTADPAGFQNVDCTTGITTPYPDPAIDKGGDDSGLPGSDISWTVTYWNENNQDALDVYIIDTLPDVDFATGGDADADLTYLSDTAPAGVTAYYSAVAGAAPVFDSGNPTGSSDWSAAPTSPVNHIAWLIGTLPADAGPFTIEVSARLIDPSSGSDVGSGLVFTNQVTIITSSTDDDPTNNTDDHDTITPGVDMAVEKSGSLEGAVPGIAPGGSLIYTLTYTNTGTSTAYGVRIEDTLPAGVSLISGDFTALDLTDAGGNSCTPLDPVGDPITTSISVARVDAAPVYTWYLGGSAPAHQSVGIPVGCSQSFTVEVELDSTLAELTVLTNQVQLTTDNKASDPPVADPDTDPFDCNELYCDNNEDFSSVTVLLPDLVIAKSVVDAGTGSEQVTDQGNILTYTIEYDNLGKIDAEGVEISEVIPAGTTYVDGSLTTPVDTTVTFGTDGGGNVTDFTIAFNNTLPAPATFTGESLVCDGGTTTGTNCTLSADDSSNATVSGNDFDVYGGKLFTGLQVTEKTDWLTTSLVPLPPATQAPTDSDACGGSREPIGDLDGDGITEVAFGCLFGDDTAAGEDTGSNTGEIWILFLNADGTPKTGSYKISNFTEPALPVTSQFGRYSLAGQLQGIDLDADGQDDTVFAERTRFISLNNDGSMKQTVSHTTAWGNALTNLGDVDGDGISDIGGIFQTSGRVVLLNSDGSAKSSTSFSYPGGFSATNTAHVSGAGDIDGNGVPDMVVGGWNSPSFQGSIVVVLLNSDGSVLSQQLITEGQGGLPALPGTNFFGMGVAGIGDIDGDGIPDIAAGDGSGVENDIYILFMQPDGTVRSFDQLESSNGFTPPNDMDSSNDLTFLGDLDGDGFPTLWGGEDDINYMVEFGYFTANPGQLEYRISPTGTLTSWNALTVSDEIPDGTTLLYTLGRQAPLGTCVYDLGATYTDIDMTGNASYLDISGISAVNNDLCLRIDFSSSDLTDVKDSAQLKAWQVSYRTEEKPSFTFQVQVDDPYAGADFIPNTVVIGTTTPETDTTNNEDDDSIRITKTDLEVTKSVDQTVVSLSDVNPGPATLTYTINYANNGPDAAENWSLTDILPGQIDPATISFVVADTSAGNAVSCALLPSVPTTNLAADCTTNGLIVTSSTENFSSRLATRACNGNTSSSDYFYSSVSGPEFWQIDLGEDIIINEIAIYNRAPTQDRWLAGTIVSILDSGSSSVYTSTALQGIPEPQTLETDNTIGRFVRLDHSTSGPLSPTEVQVWGWPASTPRDLLVCTGSADLAVGESGTITITAEIDPATPANDLLVNNVSIETDTAETDLTNNADSAQTVIDEVANVYITKTGPSSANLGDTVVFTLEFGNNGSAAAVNIDVVDTLPVGCVFDAAAQALTTPLPDSVVGQVLTWNDPGIPAPPLLPGESSSITVACTITDPNLVGTTMINPATISTNSVELTTTDNQDDHEVPIGIELVTLTGSVFHDADQSSTHEGSETPIAGITITLTGTDIFGNTVNLTTTTDAFGQYSFVGLNPSDGTGYTITETQPSDWDSTAAIVGSGASTSGTADDVNTISGIVLTGGDVAIAYDFGEFWPIEVSKTVSAAAVNNGDGTWTVVYQLTAVNNGSATFGYDLFESIEPGTSINAISATIDYDVSNTDGQQGSIISPFGPGAGTVVMDEQLGTGAMESYTVTVVYAVDVVSLQAQGSSAWSCGSQTDASGGVAFANVIDLDNPYDDETNDEACVATPTADNGDAPNALAYAEAVHVIASGLRLGAIVDEDTGSWSDGVDINGNASDDDAEALDDEDSTTFAAELNAASSYLQAVSMTNTTGSDAYFNAWVDFDGNGVFDVDERVATEQVVASGAGFSSLGYTVPDGSVVGTTYARLRLCAAVGDCSAPASISFAGEVEDYEVTLTAALSNITGLVWLDTDGDGVNDIGETGIGEVEVYLCSSPVADGVCDPSDPEFITQTLTDPGGEYNFPDLEEGNYLVQVNEANTNLTDLDNSPGNTAGASGEIVLPPGETREADFGYVPDNGTALLEGTVYSDANRDGVEDAGEVGIGGVTVNVWEDTDGDGVVDTLVGTTETGPDGSYSLTNITFIGSEVTDGRQLVVIVDETDPELVAFCDPVSIADCGTTPEQSPPVTLYPNDIVSDIDFGYDPSDLNSISDMVWHDLDNDGVLDPAEDPIVGVSVHLCTDPVADGVCDPADAEYVGTSVSDSNGEIRYDGLAEGNYILTVSSDEFSAGNALEGLSNMTSLANGTDFNVTIPSGGGDVLNAPSDDGTPNFGYDADPDELRGTVYTDSNLNGEQDIGEVGIAGVDVYLLSAGADGVLGTADDVVEQTTTTDSGGDYDFSGLTPSTDYRVVVNPDGSNQGQFPASYTQQSEDPDQGGVCTVCDHEASVVPAGSAGVDFGYMRPDVYSISDMVWNDNDRDGMLEADETPISGVTIFLCEASASPCNASTVLAQAETDADGEVDFTGVVDGSYVLVVDPNESLPGGVLEGLDNTTVTTEPVTIAGTDVLNAPSDGGDPSFGYDADPAELSGVVYEDTNADGAQGISEQGIGGVPVSIYTAGSDGLLGTADDDFIATTNTLTDGRFEFTGLTPGVDYNVVINPDANKDGQLAPGYNKQTDDPDQPGVCSDCDNETQTPAGTSGLYFGYRNTNVFTVADAVWFDSDNDGFKDPDEAPIAGVTVDLVDCGADTVCGTADDAVIGTAVTDENGEFVFTGVPDGEYQLVVTDKAGTLNPLTETTGTGGVMPVTVSGSDVNYLDDPSFGYNIPNSLSGTVWSDGDVNGVQDSDELGFSGVPIYLCTDPVADGVCDPGDPEFVGQTLTDALGDYLFINLAAGDYVVAVGVLPTSEQSGDPDQPGMACTVCDDMTTTPVTLTSGASITDIDFGYNDPLLSDISGTVFKDLDSDGTYEPAGTDSNPSTKDDNEPEIGNVSIDLIDCGTGTCFDGDEQVVSTTVTDSNGFYAFTDVPDGDYRVKVTDESNTLDGLSLTSGLDEIEVTADTAQGDVTDINFGYIDEPRTGVITSGLWIDSDGDGVRDPDETPIGYVDINLIDCGVDAVCGTADDSVVGTMPTDPDGNVMFDDLPPGVYALDVNESDPDFPSTLSEIGNYSPNFNHPNDPIPLSEGEEYDADFGYEPSAGTAGLSGVLWNDSQPDGSTGDGIQDASEVGLGGITVVLTDVTTGAAVASTTTAPDGSYVFTGLAPCSTTDPCYAVVYDPVAVTALGLDGIEPTNTPDLHALDGSTTPDGVNDNIYLVNLQDGEFKPDHDFGFDSPVAGSFGAVEGYVYYEPSPADADRDANGADDVLGTADDEPGIESVTVNLVDANGTVISTTTTSDGFTDVDGDGVIDPAGFYSFTNIAPGDYTVVVTDVNNATIGLNPTENPSAISPTLIVPAGGTAGADFGYTSEQNLGNIGSLIWFDVGGPVSSGGSSDGLFNPLQGDKGIAGVTVECWLDADGDKMLTIAGVDNLVRTVTTDENGEYYCKGLPTGGYLVRVSDDAGRLTGSIAATVIGGTGTYTVGTGPDDTDESNKMAIPLASIPTSGPSDAWYIETGSDNLTADFAITGTNSLSGTVFEEQAGTTANGLLDGGDVGTPGVTVILLVEQPDGTFVELTNATTDANGDYAFTGLPNGNYQVVVDTGGSSINGYGQTGDPDIPTSFCTSALTSICDDIAGSVTPIALTGGTNVADVDFGYQTEFVTTPITLGYFHAQSLGGGAVDISWQTVTEVAHLGFNLYVREKVGGETTRRWRRLNTELIAPAGPGDSFDVREYTFTAYGVDGKRFALGDVDVTGKETIHGPFRLDRKAGANRADRAATDWASIQAKRAAKKAARASKRKARAQKRLQKILQKSKAKVVRAPRRKGKALKSANQTDNQIESQTDQEFEMLELDNERCELEDCAYNDGDELGQRGSVSESGIAGRVDLKSHPPSLASRLLAGMFALLVPSAHALEPALETGVIEIETAEAGIYKVTYDDLLAQGVDITDVFHWRLSLTNNNEPVYIRTWGQHYRHGDRRYFGPGGGVEFVAEQSRTLYSTSNVYTLHVNAPRGFRKPIRPDTAVLPTSGSVVDYYQETTVLEPEVAYSTLSPNGDPWFGFQALSSGSDKTLTIPYRVDNFASGMGIVEAEVGAWGMTTGLHEVSISANGQLIDTQSFSGISPVRLSGEMAVGALADGVNTFSLTIPWRGVADQLALDKWQVTYPRWTIAKDEKTLEFEASGEIISISGLKSRWVRIIREDANGVMTWIPYGKMKRVRQSDKSYTIRFAGTADSANYYVSVVTNADRRVASLKLPAVQDDLLTGSASYLIVSHPDFIDSNMARFVLAKQAQGFSVKVADVEAVYTTFGAGHFGAGAIQDYIAWARANLDTEMVLLVGDDMYDYHGNKHPNAISFIPSIYDATSALVKMAPVDAKYVDFDDDDVPDMPIGRLNPKLSEEWAAMVDKTLSYGGHPNPQSIVFSADAFDAAQGYDFSKDADAMLSRMPSEWQTGVSKYYIDELGSAAARSGLLSALNSGPAVTAFVGHSGPRDWSFSGLLSASDASSMSNHGAPTVVTQWGCWNTYYATPNGSMANAFLRNPNGGAAAVLGAIALTEADHEKELAVHVFDRLFQPGMTIGDAVLQAKQAYALDHPVATHKDVILGWTLLADPALVIQR